MEGVVCSFLDVQVIRSRIEMPFPRLLKYAYAFSPSVPIGHVIVMGILSFLFVAAYHPSNGKRRVYSSIALGITVFVGLCLLDALALIRIGRSYVAYSGIDLRSEVQRLFHGDEEDLVLMLFNTVLLVPFGFVMTEYLESTCLNKWRCLGRVTLVAFGLSLCIECIQLFFRVGFFECTDLVLNTIGAVIGAGLSLVIHSIIQLFAKI